MSDSPRTPDENAVDDLPDFTRRSVEATINADSLSDAYRIVERLSDVLD